MPKQNKKETGMGTDAFFRSPPASGAVSAQQPQPATETAATKNPQTVSETMLPSEKPERRSFNLKPTTLRLLDEIQIKTMRDGDKWTLSAIVERGILLAAKDMGVSE